MPIIAVNQAASGLDIYLRFNGVLTDPTSITYEIKEPGDTVVGSDNGYKRSVGHYDARSTTIPSGYSITSPWTITWTYISPGGVTSSSAEEFTVTSSMEAAFTNIDNIIDIIKIDMGLTTEYTDSQYETLISKALRRLNRKIGTSLSISQTTGTIDPSPTDTILDLIILQTECLIAKNRRGQAVSKGIRVRDGDSSIDTTASFSGHESVVRDYCDELDKAIDDYRAISDGAATYGDIVWYGNSPVTEELDHDGESYNDRDWTSPFDN